MAGILLLALSACSDKKGDESRLCLEFYSYDTISQLNDTDSLRGEDVSYWRSIGDGVLPDVRHNPDLQPLRDSLESLGYVVFTAGQHASPRSADGMTLTDLSPASTPAGSYSVNRLDITFLSTKLAVWRDELEYYITGAAHGRSQTRYVNYDIKGKCILTLADLFKADYRPGLLEMLRERVSEDDNVFPDAEIDIPSNFHLSEKGITFVYDVYEIAPYSAGEIEVTFEPYEIGDMLSATGRQLLNYDAPE